MNPNPPALTSQQRMKLIRYKQIQQMKNMQLRRKRVNSQKEVQVIGERLNTKNRKFVYPNNRVKNSSTYRIVPKKQVSKKIAQKKQIPKNKVITIDDDEDDDDDGPIIVHPKESFKNPVVQRQIPVQNVQQVHTSKANDGVISIQPSKVKSEEGEVKKKVKKKKKVLEEKEFILQESIKEMMYGFGDVKEPLEQTMELMEDIVEGFMRNVAMKSAKNNRVKEEGILYEIKNDNKKFYRAKYLLYKEKKLSFLKQPNYFIEQ